MDVHCTRIIYFLLLLLFFFFTTIYNFSSCDLTYGSCVTDVEHSRLMADLRLLKTNTYMLCARWEVRIVKNCDRGLENAARGRRSKAAFSSLKPIHNMLIFFPAVHWFYRLQMGLFKQLVSLNQLAHRLLTICKKSWQRATRIVDKERCIEEHIFFELLYVSCIYFTN